MKKFIYYILCLLLGVLLSLFFSEVSNVICSNSKDYSTIKVCAEKPHFAAQTEENLKNFDWLVSTKTKTGNEFNVLYRRAIVACRLDSNCDVGKYMPNFIRSLELCSKNNQQCETDLRFLKENDDLIYRKSNQKSTTR